MKEINFKNKKVTNMKRSIDGLNGRLTHWKENEGMQNRSEGMRTQQKGANGIHRSRLTRFTMK
jgi:hypothetical protein